MDINEFRGAVTAITMLAFLGVWVWAWSKRRKVDFDASAKLPLEEDQYITDKTRGNS
jgi:cytochrome c oxidase cbb3-type subunit 4